MKNEFNKSFGFIGELGSKFQKKSFIYILILLKSIIVFLLSFPILLIFIVIFGLCYAIFSLLGVSDSFIPPIPEQNIVTKEELNSIGIEVTGSGKILECENIKANILLKPSISIIDGFSINEKNTENLCLYNLLYHSLVTNKFDLVGKTFSGESVGTGEILKQKYQQGLYQKINGSSITSTPFQDYNSDEIGFMGRFNFPFQSLTKNPEIVSFLGNLMVFGNNFVIIDEESRKILKITDSSIKTSIKELNDVQDYEGGKDRIIEMFGIIDKINSESNYYNFNCPICTSEKCTCTGNPEVDYGVNFIQQEKSKALLNQYIKFIDVLQSKKIVFAGGDIMSPFRDYKEKTGKSCSVSSTLTQRDGKSELSFAGFVGYPKVNGVRTHAGLDIVGISSCSGKKTPVYAIAEGVVVAKTYSIKAWGHSIVVKFTMNGEEYYARYSHLAQSSDYNVGDYISIGTVLGIQGKSGPSLGEHLDLTIYNDSKLNYSNYIRNSLETFLPYFNAIKKVNINCYNCKQ